MFLPHGCCPDPLAQELVLSFPAVVMPEALCDLQKMLDHSALYDEHGIDPLAATLVTRQVLVGVYHLHQAHITQVGVLDGNSHWLG
jgi:hypothetical protein